MIRKILKKIESKRKTKGIFWRILVFIKDFLWNLKDFFYSRSLKPEFTNSNMGCKILCFGPEGSGNRLLKDILRSHSKLRNSVDGVSLPHGRFKGIGCWPSYLKIRENQTIFIIRRTPIDSIYSAYQRFNNLTGVVFLIL